MHPITTLFNLIETSSIDYRIWKGLHKIDAAFRGENDLDVYIPAVHTADAVEILIEAGWKRFLAPVEFEGIFHWFYYDNSSSNFYHLHIYNVMRTGPTYSKHFVIEGFESLNTQYQVVNGLRIFDAKTSLKIHQTRLILKKHSLLAKLFAKREVGKHTKEEIFLHNLLPDNQKVSNSNFTYKVYREFGYFLIIKNIVKRAMSKILRKRKKLSHGISVAVIGTDGAGKSTLVKESARILSENLIVYTMSFGRPSLSILTAPLWITRKFIQAVKPIKIGTQMNPSPSETSLLRAIYHVFIAIERLYVCRRICSLLSKGCCVIVDRCPSMQIGQMDAPKIKQREGFIKYLGKLEVYIYRQMSIFDLAIKVEVELNNVIERNRKRVKSRKESDQEVEQRFRLFEDFVPYSKQIARLDGNRDFKTTLNSLVALVFDSLPVHHED